MVGGLAGLAAGRDQREWHRYRMCLVPITDRSEESNLRDPALSWDSPRICGSIGKGRREWLDQLTDPDDLTLRSSIR